MCLSQHVSVLPVYHKFPRDNYGRKSQGASAAEHKTDGGKYHKLVSPVQACYLSVVEKLPTGPICSHLPYVYGIGSYDVHGHQRYHINTECNYTERADLYTGSY